MLNKEICKRCLNEMASIEWFGNWSKYDDDIWEKQRKVMCTLRIGRNIMPSKFVSVDAPPPSGCMYMLEQSVVENNDVV